VFACREEIAGVGVALELVGAPLFRSIPHAVRPSLPPPIDALLYFSSLLRLFQPSRQETSFISAVSALLLYETGSHDPTLEIFTTKGSSWRFSPADAPVLRWAWFFDWCVRFLLASHVCLIISLAKDVNGSGFGLSRRRGPMIGDRGFLLWSISQPVLRLFGSEETWTMGLERRGRVFPLISPSRRTSPLFRFHSCVADLCHKYFRQTPFRSRRGSWLFGD